MSSESTQFPLLTAEEIEDSPSRRDGISATAEEDSRKKCANIIFSTAVQPFFRM